MGNYGIPKDYHLLPIKLLSDGLKTRLVFCEISLQTPHLLLFDEPTNAADMEVLYVTLRYSCPCLVFLSVFSHLLLIFFFPAIRLSSLHLLPPPCTLRCMHSLPSLTLSTLPSLLFFLFHFVTRCFYCSSSSSPNLPLSLRQPVSFSYHAPPPISSNLPLHSPCLSNVSSSYCR